MDKVKKKEEKAIDKGFPIKSTFFNPADDKKFPPPDYGDDKAPEKKESFSISLEDANK
ncbi:hypothetical protein ACOBQJ_12135 [Pelotomaculum propionicicum]|uniref:hypothetical protein n=1 Tax=Pelotomaculum propionicicum TaxID=258475 RepID=UPI003B81087C